jgi:hypothetical protein
MTRRPYWASALAAAVVASAASAQPVAVAPLEAPDFFSAGARDTGLSANLWREASPQTLRAVLPLLAEKPLSPAARSLAVRVLATGARGPGGAGEDPTLAGARIATLTALGDIPGASAILSRTAGVERSAPLARAAAEAALLAGDDQGACRIGESLAEGRGEVYWLRLRAYCRLMAGDAGAARLTFDLAQSQARDAVYGRLMGAKLAGAGDPGAASLRNGLDYALSRSLGLDLSGAKPSASVAAALAGGTPGEAAWPLEAGPDLADAAASMLAKGDLAGAQHIRESLARSDPGVSAEDLALLDAMIAVAADRPDAATLDRLLERAAAGPEQARRSMRGAALLMVAAGAPLSPTGRGEFAALAFDAGEGSPARLMAMDLAADQGLMGETALGALWLSANAGPAGLSLVERARTVRALKEAGLQADARAYALEGLIALR